jgi:hypothetical protein
MQTNPIIHPIKQTPIHSDGGLFYLMMGFERFNAARTSAAGDGWTEPNQNFLPPWREKMQTKPMIHPI